MAWIPGWDTATTANWWSGFYFWLSIVALISLGVFEVASHRYADRKDELAAAEEAAKDKQHNDEMARLHLEAAKANEEAAKANEEAAKAQLALEQFKAPRVVTTDLEKRLASDVRPLIPMQRPPVIGAVPANVPNLNLAAQIAAALNINLNQGVAELQVGPARGVVAVYVTLNEEGKRFAEAFAKALNDSGISAAAVPGLMEQIFQKNPQNPAFVPADPTQPGQAWVVIVVGDKP